MSKSLLAVCSTLAVTILMLVEPAKAAEELLSIDSNEECYLASAGTRVLDDLNGDGHRELALRAPAADIGLLTGAGAVNICDGATGALLFHYEGDSAEAAVGTAVAAVGDIDQDGTPDFAISDMRSTILNTSPGRVSLYSGSDGTLIYFRSVLVDEAFFGSAVEGIGDINGNGIPDWATFGGFGSQNEGLVYLYEGSTGTVIRTIRSTDLQRSFGRSSLRSLADVNGDGVPDLAVSVTGANVLPDLEDAGRVDVISGADGSTLHSVNGVHTDGCLGSILDTIGDVTGDGIIDFAATCEEMRELFIVSGADGTLLTTFSSENYSEDLYAYDAASAGDLNGDGIGDIVLTSMGYSENGVTIGRLYFYLGGDFSLFGTLEGTAERRLGLYVEFAGLSDDGATLLALRIGGAPSVIKLTQSEEEDAPSDNLFPSEFLITPRVTRNGTVLITVAFNDNWSGCSFTVRAAATRRRIQAGRSRIVGEFSGKLETMQTVLRARRISSLATAPQRRKVFAEIAATCNDVHSIQKSFELDFAANRRAAASKRAIIGELARSLGEVS